MPVLTRGVMPSSTTLRRSMPVGVPRKPRAGMVKLRVLGGGDLVHLEGGVERVLRGAADEGDDGRRGGHGEGAEPDRLGDRAVADVGVGVGAGEAREVEPLRHRRRGGEPAVAEAADADAEVGAVARHGGDDRALRDAVRGVGHRLAGRHQRVEHRERVAAQEVEDRGGGLGVAGRAREVRRQRLEQQQRPGAVAVVPLVAHVSAPRRRAPSCRRPPARSTASPTSGASVSLIQRSRASTSSAVGAVAQHLAVPLVEVGEGAAAVRRRPRRRRPASTARSRPPSAPPRRGGGRARAPPRRARPAPPPPPRPRPAPRRAARR